MSKISTGTGDKGRTRLFDMTQVPKDDMRVDAYGTVDELTSYLGLIASLSQSEKTIHFLESIQRTLYVLAADLATPIKKKQARITKEDVKKISSLIDRVEDELPELNKFILPGGDVLASHLHVARTIARRAERKAVKASKKHRLNPLIITYLNRLSDLLFLLARKANMDSGTNERFADDV
jgi:cob(I)alamin adenosyltransferase